MSYMLNKVMRFNLEKDRMKSDVKLVCQEKDTPLEERWEIFKVSELGDHEPFIQEFQSLNELFDGEVSWYDDFYKDRYQTVNMVDIVDDLEFTEEQINTVKEEILEKFVLSFVNDW